MWQELRTVQLYTRAPADGKVSVRHERVDTVQGARAAAPLQQARAARRLVSSATAGELAAGGCHLTASWL